MAGSHEIRESRRPRSFVSFVVVLPGPSCLLYSGSRRGHRHSTSIDRRPAAAPRRRALRGGSRPGGLALSRAAPEAAALPRGRGRRRQDRAGRGDGGRARHRSHSPSMLRGPGRQPRAVRVGLRAAAPRTAHSRRGPLARSSERARASSTARRFSSSGRCCRPSIRCAPGRPSCSSTRSIAPTRSSKDSSSSCWRSFRSRFPSSAPCAPSSRRWSS